MELHELGQRQVLNGSLDSMYLESQDLFGMRVAGIRLNRCQTSDVQDLRVAAHYASHPFSTLRSRFKAAIFASVPSFPRYSTWRE